MMGSDEICLRQKLAEDLVKWLWIGLVRYALDMMMGSILMENPIGNFGNALPAMKRIQSDPASRLLE